MCATCLAVGAEHGDRRVLLRQHRASFCQRRDWKVAARSTALERFEEESEEEALEALEVALPAHNSLHAFFKFSRPHTMLGTFVSIVSVSLMAVVRFSNNVKSCCRKLAKRLWQQGCCAVSSSDRGMMQGREQLGPPALLALVQALVPALLMNIHIVRCHFLWQA